MKKVILFSLLLSLSCLPVPAQKEPAPPKTTCPLRLDQSPELRGFRMGMTQAAVLARLPGVTIEKPDKFGLARLKLSIIDTTALVTSSARDKGVQLDPLAPNDGSAFVLDSRRFPAFKGVRKIQMRLIDGRLAYVQISYGDDVKWESVDQFVDTISTTLKLPKEWQVPEDSDGGTQQKELRCEGFVIAANTAGDPTDLHAGPELVLQDQAAWTAMSKRQTDIVEKARREEEDKRKAFKP
jgi:hypothetical protein